ncbi:TnsA-like heteromeric transposase endonuclease subunit [Streptomyces coelicoflavus]|uniref:TnsA-like heteromeric transposase endonuclease subunit n=1 Tax=Streptomyces coelicoflavus TaxID=285562 RepID=UPI0036CB475B
MAGQRPRRSCSTHNTPTASIRYTDGSTREVPLDLLRLRDFDESGAWRRVRAVHGMANFSGDYASATTGDHVVYESRLELARLLLADFDPSVCGIFAQPFRMVAPVDGRVRSHVPDFLLVMRSGTVRVVNVKPASRLEDPQVAEALAWSGHLLERHGWEYEVWSGAEPTLLENVRFLAAYRHRGVVPEADVERAWREVVDGEELALAERRLAGDLEPEEARPALMALLWSGRLTTDLAAGPLSGECVLRRRG